jgi:superfamily II DNA/RNA helicase
VINYDMPDTTDAYTHRIGRTGRAAKTGDAFTFASQEDEPLIKSIERVLGSKIERRILDGFDYTKAAPRRDTEFARPPRPPQHRTTQPKAEKHAPSRTAVAGPPTGPSPKSPADTAHAAKTAGPPPSRRQWKRKKPARSSTRKEV